MMHTQNSALIVLPNLVHSNNHWSQAQTQFLIYTSFFFFVEWGGGGGVIGPSLPRKQSASAPSCLRVKTIN